MEITQQVIRQDVKVSDLHPFPRNYNQHSPAQIAKLAKSLSTFGQVRSIVGWVNPDDGLTYILAGHGVVEAARSLHWLTMRADVLTDCSYDTAMAYVVADNELARQSDPDQAQLAAILEELQAREPVLVEAAGYSTADLEQLLRLVNPKPAVDAEPQVDRAEELRVKWDVHSGQLWACGDHRLICGDCTDAAVVARVMAGERAALCMTSPPYWVEREYEREFTLEDISAHIKASAKAIVSAMTDDGRIVINTMAVGRTKETGGRRSVDLLLDKWQSAFEEHDWLLRNVRIWQKEGGWVIFTAQQDMQDMHWEFLGTFWSKPRAQNPCKESWITQGLWDIQPQTKDVNHSAPFPVEIPRRYILTYLRSGECVYEPYAGSGTTLIACENLSCRCRAVEISPAYVAVCLERYYTATGVTPELVTAGLPLTLEGA